MTEQGNGGEMVKIIEQFKLPAKNTTRTPKKMPYTTYQHGQAVTGKSINNSTTFPYAAS